MKRGKALGTLVVLLCLVFAGFYARSLLRRHSASAKSQPHSPTLALNARAKALPASPSSSPTQPSLSHAEINPKLFQIPSALWNKPIPEEPFARFHDWAEKFQAADLSLKPTLESEGI